jgi:GGDEF domain-containing protein
VVQKVAEALRGQVRDFDVLARSGESEFRFLLPDAEADAGETVSRLARSVAEAVAGDESLNAPARVALAFGYAAFPDDAADRDALLQRSATPRIRMV